MEGAGQWPLLIMMFLAFYLILIVPQTRRAKKEKNFINALKRGDRVELRGFGVFSTNTQKARISRNPKTGEKVNTPEKKTIHFKMSKDLFKKLNNNEE